jgi:hypothetical protein
MLSRSERDYYQRRARDELAAARVASQSSIANIHLELFRRYLGCAAGEPAARMHFMEI